MTAMKRFLTFLALLGALCSHAAAGKPNVVIFLADDSGCGDYSFSGNTHLRTPNINSIARAWASLDRF